MFSVLVFLLAIVLANLSVTSFGPASIPINSFLLIGLDLSLRDRIHEKWHGKSLGLNMFGLICAGAVITWFLNHNAGMICVASVIAFAGALMADALLYEKFFSRPKFHKMNISNIGSAAVDSILFPTIAFGLLMPDIVLLQFLAKVFGGAIWAWILTKKSNVRISRPEKLVREINRSRRLNRLNS